MEEAVCGLVVYIQAQQDLENSRAFCSFLMISVTALIDFPSCDMAEHSD